ncbi:MAG: exopolysaccharide biosynthesis polyprenyl glycosylphosphotransferase [Actinobacteria bacterium]|nr:exopolysaccharide biosynthesis polyprenyl glycosylphosphotransferase [Actinomycetota bacterium]
MATEPVPPQPVQEDVRAARPYLLTRNPLKTAARRLVSVAGLVVVDLAGLVIGLYLALAFRSLLFDPRPILWNLLWQHETDWLSFLTLLLVLVFWRNRLYAPREVREGPGRVVASVALVALLALVFAIGTGQHFTTFGLYVVSALLVATLISVFRWSYETASGAAMRSFGVRRRALLVGEAEQVAHLKRVLGASRGGIDYDFVGEVPLGAAVANSLAGAVVDELIVADAGLDEERLLGLVEAAHRRGVKVRVAPRTTELLVERGEYVPGQAVPLFELRPPTFAGSDWVVKRSFDLVVSALLVVVGAPLWLLIALLIKLDSRGPVFYADARVGLGEREFGMFKFRTMVADAARAQSALEAANEASGALFKIRRDPRVTRVGRVLRRYSIDEMPNVLNVLRGEMSLVGPRPLPLRDYARLEPWHRRRSNVLPGMTGLWQIAGRSDLSFDDLVRLDFYYLENWSLWIDVTILLKTVPAVLASRGAY